MPRVALLLPLALLGLSLACTGSETDEPPAAERNSALAAADARLAGFDLPAAENGYRDASRDPEAALGAAIGASYLAFLRGDVVEADRALATVEATAGTARDGIRLRRAMLALEVGKIDRAVELCKANELPAARMIRAEDHLSTGRAEEARALLDPLSRGGDGVAQLARNYLRLLDHPNHLVHGLADSQALWALGAREDALASALPLLPLLTETSDVASGDLLLWAGRAATGGRPEEGLALLDAVGEPPVNQGWRVEATRAIALVALGRDAEGLRIFASLSKRASRPDVMADGLADARATAITLSRDKDTALELADDLQTAAVAVALLHAGEREAALKAAPPGTVIRTYLESP